MLKDYIKKLNERRLAKEEELERIAKRKFLMELREPGSTKRRRTRPPMRLTSSTGPK